jgi:hypothetical protein
MATVILSENRNFLSESGGYTNSFLCANKPGQVQLLSRGFLNNFVDALGNIGSNLLNITTNATAAASQIVTGVGTGVSGYVSNPDNIAQIGGAVATGLTGMPVNLQNAPSQQMPNFEMQNQNPLDQLLQNPVLLIGGAALIYLIVKK